jgi:glutamate formiminotransferase/formiminotetrahydrofolate cyclodeaminase
MDELYPFDPQKKVIEYVLEGDNTAPLVNLKVHEFVETVSSESPAPGGGSVAALCGALGGALGAMVANLSANKKGWDDKVSFFSELAEPLVRNQERLLHLVDEDTQAFNRVMEAYRLPKATEAEKALYAQAVEKANQGAASIPLLVMETAFSNYQWLEQLIEHGNPNSITDVGVGVLCTHACIEGAALNVEINLSSVQEEAFKTQAVEKVSRLRLESLQMQTELLGKVRQKMA